MPRGKKNEQNREVADSERKERVTEQEVTRDEPRQARGEGREVEPFSNPNPTKLQDDPIKPVTWDPNTGEPVEEEGKPQFLNQQGEEMSTPGLEAEREANKADKEGASDTEQQEAKAESLEESSGEVNKTSERKSEEDK